MSYESGVDNGFETGSKTGSETGSETGFETDLEMSCVYEMSFNKSIGIGCRINYESSHETILEISNETVKSIVISSEISYKNKSCNKP